MIKLCIDIRIELLEKSVRRNNPLFENQHSLHSRSKTTGSLKMSEIGFYRTTEDVRKNDQLRHC